MTPIKRFNLWTSLVALLIIVLSLSALTYFTAGSSDVFTWSLINPYESIQGMIFFLGFGFGFNLFGAITTIVIALIAIWALLTMMIRTVCK